MYLHTNQPFEKVFKNYVLEKLVYQVHFNRALMEPLLNQCALTFYISLNIVHQISNKTYIYVAQFIYKKALKKMLAFASQFLPPPPPPLLYTPARTHGATGILYVSYKASDSPLPPARRGLAQRRTLLLYAHI